MKFLPVYLDRRGFEDFRPSKDWFEYGVKNACETTDAKLLMELYKRVNLRMFKSVFEMVCELNRYEQFRTITFEEACEKLQEILNTEIKTVSDELAKELIAKGKWTSPRFDKGEYKGFFAYYEERNLINLDLPGWDD